MISIVEHLGNSTILYVDTPAGQLIVEGEGNLDAKAGRNRRPQAQREPRASVRRNGGGALIGASAATPFHLRFGRESQHDVLIVIAEPSAEDVDAARMARVRLDLDPNPDRMVGGQVEIF